MIRRLALLLRLHVAVALVLACASVALPSVALAGPPSPGAAASAAPSAAPTAAEEVMPDSPRASVSRFLDLGRIIAALHKLAAAGIARHGLLQRTGQKLGNLDVLLLERKLKSG